MQTWTLAPPASPSPPPPPPPPQALHDVRSSSYLHHPGRDDRSGNGYNTSRDDEDDDFSDLQRLISLAGLPFCRATRTFGGRSSYVGTSTAPSTSALTAATSWSTTTPPRDAEHLSPPNYICFAKGHDEAPRLRTRTLDPSPVVAQHQHDHRRALLPLPSLAARNNRPRDGADPTNWNDEEGIATGKEGDGDVSCPPHKSPTPPSDDKGVADPSFESDFVAADDMKDAPLNGRPRNPVCEERMTSGPDVDRSRLEPPYPVRRQTQWEILKDNEQFLALNFAPPTDSSWRLYTCRVCDQQVFRRNSSCLLQHATTRGCLVERFERRPHSAGGDAATQNFAHVSPRLMTDALALYRAEHFAPPATDAAESAGNWRCRRCDMGVTRTGAQPCFQHAAGCIGIVPALQDLERVLQAIATSSGVVLSSVGSEKQEEFSPVARRPIEAPPLPPLPPLSRTRDAILEENKVFVATNFAPEEASGRMTCTICTQRFANDDWRAYLRHAVSRACLLRHADLTRLVFAAAAGADGAPAGQRLPPGVSVIDLDVGAVAEAFKEYQGRHFRSGGADGCLNYWECRRCGEWFRDSSRHPLLYHLIQCVGVVSVIRDLVGILHSMFTARERRAPRPIVVRATPIGGPLPPPPPFRLPPGSARP